MDTKLPLTSSGMDIAPFLRVVNFAILDKTRWKQTQLMAGTIIRFWFNAILRYRRSTNNDVLIFFCGENGCGLIKAIKNWPFRAGGYVDCSCAYACLKRGVSSSPIEASARLLPSTRGVVKRERSTTFPVRTGYVGLWTGKLANCFSCIPGRRGRREGLILTLILPNIHR